MPPGTALPSSRLTLQLVLLLLGAPLHAAAPELSHGPDHIPATGLAEEQQVLGKPRAVGGGHATRGFNGAPSEGLPWRGWGTPGPGGPGPLTWVA